MLENKYQAETGWQMSESVKAVLTENFRNERKHSPMCRNFFEMKGNMR